MTLTVAAPLAADGVISSSRLRGTVRGGCWGEEERADVTVEWVGVSRREHGR